MKDIKRKISDAEINISMYSIEGNMGMANQVANTFCGGYPGAALPDDPFKAMGWFIDNVCDIAESFWCDCVWPLINKKWFPWS